jgi:hypothetical protein
MTNTFLGKAAIWTKQGFDQVLEWSSRRGVVVGIEMPFQGGAVNRFIAILLLSLFSMASHAQDLSAADALQIQIPLRIETLGTDLPTEQVGKAIIVSDLADADKQISTVLLRGLQELGLLIESPKLDLSKFLLPEQDWRSSILQIDAAWVSEHNASVGAPPLPPGRIYAVQYSGRYQYAPAVLRIALVITLFERSQLGPLRKVSFAYSSRYFADRLERSIQAQLPAGLQKK